MTTGKTIALTVRTFVSKVMSLLLISRSRLAVKNLPAILNTRVPSLGWRDPLEKEMAIHSSVLAWRIHGQRSLAGSSPCGFKESDTTEWLTLFTFTRSVLTFLPRSKCLLISWLESPSPWFWSPRKENLSLLPLYSLLFAWRDGTECHDLSFLNVEF